MPRLTPKRRFRKREVAEALMDRLPGRFSRELGLTLQSRRSRDLFLWFLASLLFGARISGTIVSRTHAEFVRRGLVTPERILRTGWDRLVDALDAGGYARYDFKTATKLLEVMGALTAHYGGDLDRLHATANDSSDLEARLKGLGKGIGESLASRHLHLLDAGDLRPGRSQVQALKGWWKKRGVSPYTFCDFEAALVRLGRGYCRRQRWQSCPMRDYCGGKARGN